MGDLKHVAPPDLTHSVEQEVRKPAEIQTNRWYGYFNDVRTALGDRCILDSTVDEVIECVAALAEHARKTGYDPQINNP